MSKTVAIFNEKGGVGKSTLTALFTSWLAYSQGETVTVLDFDGPSYQYATWREKELKVAKDTSSELHSLASPKPYDIFKVPETDAPRMTKIVRSAADTLEGYIFLEFGGSFREGKNDPSYVLLTSGAVDELIIPVTTDEQTIDAAFYIVMTLRNLKKNGVKVPRMTEIKVPRVTVVWNNISMAERRTGGKHDFFSVAEAQFRALGAEVLPGRFRRNEILSRPEGWCFFVRNTLCWPSRHISFMQMGYMEEIFAELKKQIDKI